MAGLSFLLGTTPTTTPATPPPQRQHPPSSARPPHVISRSTFVAPSSPAASSTAPAPVSSFLQRCFLCRRELADGRDIYIYRGDRAFCSDECRCRHILMEEAAAAWSSPAILRANHLGEGVSEEEEEGGSTVKKKKKKAYTPTII